MKYGIIWEDTHADTVDWLQKADLNEGFDDNGKFATYNINEVYQKLERTRNNYKNATNWFFEAEEKE